MLLPAVTGSGVPTSVTLRSACPAAAETAMFTTAVLSAGFVSRVAVAAVAVSVMMVPEAVPAVTLTTSWKFAVVAGASVEMLQFTFPAAPTAGVVQLQLAGQIAETNVVFAGVAWLKVTVAALLGPPFTTVCV